MVRIEARLRPEEAAVVLQALDVARRRASRSGASRGADAGGVSAEGGRTARSRTAEEPADTSAETSPPARRAGQGQHYEPPPALSRADALVAVAESSLASVAVHEDGHDAAGLPVELVVHVDHAALAAGTDGKDDRRDDPHAPDAAKLGPHAPDAAKLGPHAPDAAKLGPHAPDAAKLGPHATLADGTPLALATARRLACDTRVVLVDDARDARAASDAESLPSRRTRRISPRLRRALRLRDDGCRFPGCTNRLTDAHHVVGWIDGGATSLSNLLSLCRRHHRFVHEHAYRVVVARDGGPRFFRRDGQPVPLADEPLRSSLRNDSHSGGASGAAANPDVLAALRAAHAARGVAIEATTAFPRRDGTRLDAHLAVQALLGAAGSATTNGS